MPQKFERHLALIEHPKINNGYEPSRGVNAVASCSAKPSWATKSGALWSTGKS